MKMVMIMMDDHGEEEHCEDFSRIDDMHDDMMRR